MLNEWKNPAESVAPSLFPLSLRRLALGLRTSDARKRWPAVRHSVEQELAGFSESSEGLFLKTGARLMNLQALARQIASQARSVAELMSHDGGSLSALEAVLESASQDRTENRIVANAATVHENSLQIHRAIQSFERLINTFDVLGKMTRIESARLQSAGGMFAGLADTVMTLARQIRQQISTTATYAEALVQTTAEAGQELDRIAQLRRDSLGPLARQAGLTIQEIAERRRHAAHDSELLGQRLENVSTSFDDLVQALQSHDIVRQQIEHVFAALRQPQQNTFAVARLQAAQLVNSRTILERSVSQLHSALKEIEQTIDEITNGLGLAQVTTDASSAGSLEANLTGILKVLERNQEADRRLVSEMAAIAEEISGISDTISGIQTIGIEMHRIALNATIQAVHLGHSGRSLEVVASRVLSLASEAGHAASTIDSGLDAIRSAAQVLGEAASKGNSADLIPEIKQSLAGLASNQQQARDSFAQTAAQVVELKRQIRVCISAFGSQDESLARLSKAAGALEQFSASGPQTMAMDTKQLAAAYTMDSEREVLKSLSTAETKAEPAPAAVKADEVEFF